MKRDKMRKPLNITIRTITANIRSAVLRHSLACLLALCMLAVSPAFMMET